MIEQTYKLGDEPIRVSTVEGPEDLLVFEEWLYHWMTKVPIGVDSETTGLLPYAIDHILSVQFGTRSEGWVIPLEGRNGMLPLVRGWLEKIPLMVYHNASFDLQVFEQSVGLLMEQAWPRVLDTRIIGHLVDPRGPDDNTINVYGPDGKLLNKRKRPGGPYGHRLEVLLEKYISKKAADEVKRLMAKLARENKTTKDKVWKLPGLVDMPEFQLYAGMDPVWNVRLLEILNPLVPEVSRHLIRYEHELAQVSSYTERNGLILDHEYSEQLWKRLLAEEDEAKWHLDTYFDLQSANATQQIVEVLEYEFGMQPDEFTYTPKGAAQVDKALLERLAADEPMIGSASHLANAIIEAKRARKWRTTWVDNFIAGMDSAGRVHASINPLRARTARWSITGIPAQTLPSGDWLIRRCFLADEGHRICSVDYDAQELRVLAALSQDETMMQAFRDGADLHQMTADAAGVPRKVGKMANFGTIYGAGAAKLALQGGISDDKAREVLRQYSTLYPGVTAYKKYLQKLGADQGYITTPIGRVLPVDEERPYSAVNYMCQSTARDITCRGVLNLHKAGFTPYLRLVIHDECLLSLPEKDAGWMTEAVAQLIGTEFRGVNVTASGDVNGKSWGSGYMCFLNPGCSKPKDHKGGCNEDDWARWKS